MPLTLPPALGVCGLTFGSLRYAARFSLPSLAGRDASPALGFHRVLGAACIALGSRHIWAALRVIYRFGAWGRDRGGLQRCLLRILRGHTPQLPATLRRRRRGPTKYSSSFGASHASCSVRSCNMVEGITHGHKVSGSGKKLAPRGQIFFFFLKKRGPSMRR